MQNILAMVFISAGLFFVSVAAIGTLRLPDFYTRLHASGKSETLGITLSFVGLAVYEAPSLISLKLLVIAVLVIFGNPIGTHAISRAAYRYGLVPWTKEKQKEGER